MIVVVYGKYMYINILASCHQAAEDPDKKRT